MTQEKAKKVEAKKVEAKPKNEHPILERERLDVGKITGVKGMMPLLRQGGEIDVIAKEFAKFGVKHNLNANTQETAKKRILQTIDRIKKENKESNNKINPKRWWTYYKIVSDEKNIKLELKPLN